MSSPPAGTPTPCAVSIGTATSVEVLMSTTVHAHPRPGIRSSHAPLVTLGWRHFTVLIVVLLLFAALFLIVLSPFITR